MIEESQFNNQIIETIERKNQELTRVHSIDFQKVVKVGSY